MCSAGTAGLWCLRPSAAIISPRRRSQIRSAVSHRLVVTDRGFRPHSSTYSPVPLAFATISSNSAEACNNKRDNSRASLAVSKTLRLGCPHNGHTCKRTQGPKPTSSTNHSDKSGCLTDAARTLGFFFCGLGPSVANGADTFLLQWLSEPLDTGKLQASPNRPKKLVAFIDRDRAAVGQDARRT